MPPLLKSYMKKVSKFFLTIGSTLSVLGLFSFLFLLWQHSVLSDKSPLLYLILLGVLFLGYVGVPLLLLGVFLWSFQTGRSVQILVWSVLAVILATFVPLPSVCPVSDSDVVICEAYYPYQARYWNLARNSVTDNNASRDVYWRSMGMFLFIQEGYGDVWKEIKVTKERIYTSSK